ncbi:hypothetical protein D8674_027224 [Pyrus ussuriensis x Pyrus communis]|uniref:Uncharacterized protein n=1 Tax=Pyrus ussuriensis x Pyrus communis TaxID=2448454 RepID=A0A5N5IGD9_9ROSA|nr:hypothetical protein D8674_027224 [Pyrus ussuriensis x Pyrus communis]
MGEPDLVGDMEELGIKLGSNLKLSERERRGIGLKDFEEALIGFHFCVVAEVLTKNEVHRDAFIDRFTSLWRDKDLDTV